MSSIANIVAFDGASTPVTHTLVPESVTVEKGVKSASYKESLTTVPDYAQIRSVMKQNKLSSGVIRVSTRVSVPVMESVSGVNSSGYTAAPKVAYEDTVEIVGYFSPRSTIAGRRLVRQLCVNIANGVSTSVAAATTGPASELFDQLIMPN